MRRTKVPSRFTDHLDHYLVVFKDDNIKKIVSADEIKNCDKVEKGASCDVLWTDAHHKDWYPAFVVDIGDLEYLTNVQRGRTNQKKKLPTESKAPQKTAKAKTTKEASNKEDKGEKGKRKRSHTESNTKTTDSKSDQEENNSEEEREERKRKKLRIEAKAKKAADAKAAKEALLKQRLQQAKAFEMSKQSCSSSHGCSQEVIDSGSEQSDNVEDEYFPGLDEEVHSEDDLIGMEVTKAYSSPLKELFQEGASKVVTISRKEKGSRKQTTETQEHRTPGGKGKQLRNTKDQQEYDVYTSTPVRSPRALESYRQQKEKQGSQPALSNNSNKCGQEECILLRQENSKLKQRIKELEQKVNEQFSEDTQKPLAGVISPVLAAKYKMEEMAIGSGVFWYPTQRLNALAEGKTVGAMTAYLTDVMFDKDTLMISNLAGGGNLGYKQLCPRTVQAMTAFVQSNFKDGDNVAKVRKTIQDKCTGSRRGISKKK